MISVLESANGIFRAFSLKEEEALAWGCSAIPNAFDRQLIALSVGFQNSSVRVREKVIRLNQTAEYRGDLGVAIASDPGPKLEQLLMGARNSIPGREWGANQQCLVSPRLVCQ